MVSSAVCMFAIKDMVLTEEIKYFIQSRRVKTGDLKNIFILDVDTI